MEPINCNGNIASVNLFKNGLNNELDMDNHQNLNTSKLTNIRRLSMISNQKKESVIGPLH